MTFFFFLVLKNEVICIRIPTVCWMDGKAYLCQILKVHGVRHTDTHAAEPLVPKPSAVGGGMRFGEYKVDHKKEFKFR